MDFTQAIASFPVRDCVCPQVPACCSIDVVDDNGYIDTVPLCGTFVLELMDFTLQLMDFVLKLVY